MKTVWVSLSAAMLLAQPVLAANAARNQQMRSGASQTTSSQPAAVQPSETQSQQNARA